MLSDFLGICGEISFQKKLTKICVGLKFGKRL